MNKEWKCRIGFHLWHKAIFKTGMRLQTYATKTCERCGHKTEGYAKRNHPDFRKVSGLKDD